MLLSKYKENMCIPSNENLIIGMHTSAISSIKVRLNLQKNKAARNNMIFISEKQEPIDYSSCSAYEDAQSRYIFSHRKQVNLLSMAFI